MSDKNDSLSIDELIDLSNKIINNIQKKGFERYDPTDIRSLNTNLKSRFSRCYLKFLLIAENFFPNNIRKFLKVKKQNYSTAYVHVAEALLCAEICNIKILNTLTSQNVCDSGLQIFLKKNYFHGVLWPWKENRSFCPIQVDRYPSMPLHGLARYNMLLLKIADHSNRRDYLNISYKSAINTIQNHIINYYSDGRVSISYEYNSDDCTINVNTEFIQWLCMFPKKLHTSQFTVLIEGILKMVLTEQNIDGSWYYFSKHHHKKWNIKKYTIDCHHTATVLTNLIKIIEYYEFSLEMKNEIILSINKGMNYFLEHIFDMKTGRAILLVNSKRPAGIVQYSEAIFSFCNYCLNDDLDQNIKKKIRNILPKVVFNLCKFIQNDGSVPSEKVLCWMNYDSIRWGNGPALQAIMTYIAFLKYGQNE